MKKEVRETKDWKICGRISYSGTGKAAAGKIYHGCHRFTGAVAEADCGEPILCQFENFASTNCMCRP
jgi:hypothetical protein